MKMVKKVLGIILIVAGGTSVLSGIAIMIAGAVQMTRLGITPLDVVMMLLFLSAVLASIGIVYAGVRLCRGKARKENREKTFRNTEEIRQEREQFRQYTEDTREEHRKPPVKTDPVHYSRNDNKFDSGQSDQESPVTSLYTLLVEDSFTIHGEGSVIMGIVKGGTMSAGDRVWIQRADGTQMPVRAEKLQVFSGGELKRAARAEADTRIGFWTKDVAFDAVPIGSVIRSTVS